MNNFIPTSSLPFSSFLYWKKDAFSNYKEANALCTEIFGFEKPDDILGCSDYDIPSKLSNSADIFRQHDEFVMRKKVSLKLLEVCCCANNEWKVFLVTKSPLLDASTKVYGTEAYSVDITTLFLKLPNFFELICTPEIKQKKRNSYLLNYNRSDIDLSERQSECLFFLMRGKPIHEIADILNLSVRTVEHYIESIKNKFNCNKKTELIEAAHSLGFANIVPKSIFKKPISIILETSNPC